MTEPPREAASDDLDAKIEAIQAQYQSIVFDVNLEARTFGDAATVYLRNGGIVSVASYHMEDPDAVTPKSRTEHYHFSGGAGAPFFVFVEREGYDDLLVLYNFQSFSSDTNLVLLNSGV